MQGIQGRHGGAQRMQQEPQLRFLPVVTGPCCGKQGHAQASAAPLCRGQSTHKYLCRRRWQEYEQVGSNILWHAWQIAETLLRGMHHSVNGPQEIQKDTQSTHAAHLKSSDSKAVVASATASYASARSGGSAAASARSASASRPQRASCWQVAAPVRSACTAQRSMLRVWFSSHRSEFRTHMRLLLQAAARQLLAGRHARAQRLHKSGFGFAMLRVLQLLAGGRAVRSACTAQRSMLRVSDSSREPEFCTYTRIALSSRWLPAAGSWHCLAWLRVELSLAVCLNEAAHVSISSSSLKFGNH